VTSAPRHPHRVPIDRTGREGRGLPPRLWPIADRLLFRLSFHNAYRWRNALLRAFGAEIEPTVRIRPSCRIDHPWNLSMARKSALGDGVVIYAAAPVRIGERSVISQFTVMAATGHAGSPLDAPEPRPITVGHDCWIAAESYVPGGAVVPDGVVVGARSVLSGPLEPWTIAAGDPAKSRRERPYRGR